MYDALPLLWYLITGEEEEEEKLQRSRGLLQHLWEREKKFERRRKRKRWVMNYRADHFRLGPGRERERPREREIHPPFFHAPSGTWEATGESNLWPIEAAATSLGRQRVDP